MQPHKKYLRIYLRIQGRFGRAALLIVYYFPCMGSKGSIRAPTILSRVQQTHNNRYLEWNEWVADRMGFEVALS
uniref:Transposase n=1 Tax=Panagrellus redivivus TaxID=6233 RepID=A0A7E4VCV0_PANRE